MGTKTLKQIQEERILLFEETEKIYQTAPPTNDKAYKQAQKALKENEELTFSKEEIDRFLPEQLHYDSPIHQDNLQRHIIAE